MGAQDEYLRNFCILLTDKGVVPLTDPLQIAVYNSLKTDMKRPSDLATELKLGSSSLHFIIDKMAESGIIDRIKPETDKKTVYYTTNAKLLAGSMETSDALIEVSQKTFEDPLRNYKGLSSVANMLDCYTSEIGFNVDPLKKVYAESLADSIDIGKSNIEDAVLDIRDVFSKLTGFSFTVFSFSPLTLVVKGDETVMSKAPMMMQFIVRLIENSTGKSYKVTGVEPFNGSDDMIKVSMERAEKEVEPYMNSSLLHRDDSHFLVVDLDGSAGLMTSQVQMEIVDAIYERPLCITDIVNRVDSPRSTITSNLLRMVEEGVISVFYSESGSAYYGLACSILLKRSRKISSDMDEMRDTLDSVKAKEGAFMEGYLLFTLAYLKKLGFDSEYLMVVLGAKYMRATGSMEVRGNFDTYFGQMSDIAQAIGLSLSIVSVYPLTIGISCADPESQMSQAMTFIEGMAHQGLEMASSGIFVRSTEEDQLKENVSFKEIYPALSMTPVKGVLVENLAPDAVPKKRTSSVKTALLNRNRKEANKPVRTVRYITAIALFALMAAVVLIGVTDTSTTDAETFELTIDDSLGITVYDDDGSVLTYPYNIVAGSVVTLTITEPTDIGYVQNGIAYLMSPSDDGNYKVKMGSNLYIEQLYDISENEGVDDCVFSIYCSSKPIENLSYSPITSVEYREKSNGLYVSKNFVVGVPRNSGFFIADNSSVDPEVYPQNMLGQFAGPKDFKIKAVPGETKTIYLGDDEYYYNGQKVRGEIVVDRELKSIELKLAADINVDILADGIIIDKDNEDCFILELPPAGEIHLTTEKRDFY